MEKKKCPRCGHSKIASEFNRNKKRKDGLQSYCRSCQNLTERELYHESDERKKKIRISVTNQIAKLRKLVKKIKSDSGCLTCSESEPVCLVFHHLNSREKEIEVSVAVQRGWAVATLMREIEKCVILCRNCHAKVHAGIIGV